MPCKKVDGKCEAGCVLNPTTRRCNKQKVSVLKHKRNFKPSKDSTNPVKPSSVSVKPSSVSVKPSSVSVKPSVMNTTSSSKHKCQSLNDDDRPLRYALQTLMPYLGLFKTITRRSSTVENIVKASPVKESPNPETIVPPAPSCRRGTLPSKLGGYPPDMDPTVGDYHDVMCVAVDQKPLAAFDQSKYGKRLVRHNQGKNLIKIREIITYATKAGVQIMSVQEKSGRKNYMKSVAFKPNQRSNALKLLLILHGISYPNGTSTESEVVYFIGHLLGYELANIKRYLQQTHNSSFTGSDVLRCNQMLKSFDVQEASYSSYFKVTRLSVFKP